MVFPTLGEKHHLIWYVVWKGAALPNHPNRWASGLLGRHYILRTAWLYGEGNNFVRTMLRLAEGGQPLKVVHDQIGTPTSTVELTKAILRLLDSDAFGTYHATCQGQCSWYEFACEIFRQAGKVVDVTPVTTAEFPVRLNAPPIRC